MSNLSAPYLHEEEAAYAFLEEALWPEGPVCPHCGCMGRIKKIPANPEKRVRLGLHRCGDCKKQFTVKIGTVFEDSNVKLSLWLQAVVLMTSSKKGFSAHQLHRTLGVTYKTAWFMAHRIREAMRSGDLAPPMGVGGGIVEVDETYIGREPGQKKRPKGGHHKMKVLSLIDRSTGQSRSFAVKRVSKTFIMPILRENIDREARIMTDEGPWYRGVSKEFAGHGFVNHGDDEWARGEIHVNTAESFFSVFKRGMKGVYQHCGRQHLHRYLAEFDFRYTHRSAAGVEDQERARLALTGIKGKRLTYRESGSRAG